MKEEKEEVIGTWHAAGGEQASMWGSYAKLIIRLVDAL